MFLIFIGFIDPMVFITSCYLHFVGVWCSFFCSKFLLFPSRSFTFFWLKTSHQIYQLNNWFHTQILKWTKIKLNQSIMNKKNKDKNYRVGIWFSKTSHFGNWLLAELILKSHYDEWLVFVCALGSVSSVYLGYNLVYTDSFYENKVNKLFSAQRRPYIATRAIIVAEKRWKSV